MSDEKKTIYKLKSKPDEIIEIPQEYANRAQKVLKDLEGITNQRQLVYFISANFYPVNNDEGIDDAKSIYELKSAGIGEKDSQLYKLEDSLYLKICIKKVKSSLEASLYLAGRGHQESAEKAAEQEELIKKLKRIVNDLKV